MKKTVAWILAAALLITNMSPMTVQAQEVESANVIEEDQKEITQESEEMSLEEGEQVTQESSEQVGEEPTKEEPSEEADDQQKMEELPGDVSEEEQKVTEEDVIHAAAEDVLKYVYIDYPEITEETKQNIVVAVGEDDTQLDSAELTLVYGGGEMCLEAEKFAGNAALFAKDFSEDIGFYQLKSMKYVVDGTTYEVSFENCDMENVSFTVGAEKADARSMEAAIEPEIVTFDADGNPVEQNSIAEAIAEAAQEVPSKAKMRTMRSNTVIVLDPGHDNTHAGARGNGLSEESLTLKIAQYCKTALEQYNGVQVYMTREGGGCPYPGTNSTDCNANRVAYAKSVGADVFVSIHLNSSLTDSASGAEVYYPNQNYIQWIGNEGKDLASKVESQLAALGLNNRGIKIENSKDGTTYPDGSLADYYGVIRRSKEAGFPAIIVEHAFLSNAGDAAMLSSEAGLKKLGEADARGIAEYFGLSKDMVTFSSGELKIINVDNTAGTFKVNITGISPADKLQRVKFAVWGEVNGQNDIKWYEGEKEGNNSYTYTVKVSNHGFEEGTYQIHAYTTDIYGNEKILKSATASVSLVKPVMGSLNVTSVDGTKGTFRVVVGSVGQENAAAKVEVAVWSQSNQSDLKWYTLTRNSDGSYGTTVDISNHNYNYGTYNVHGYITSISGQKKFAKGIQAIITKPPTKLTSQLNSNQTICRITGDGVSYPGGIKGVKFAVWSEEGGQDDLKWYNAVKNANGSWTFDVKIIEHKTAGRYQVHMYAELLNGTQKILDSTVFTVSSPKLTELVGENKDSLKGEFYVKALGVQAVSGIEKVEVAVWSQSNQSDLKWYTLDEDGSGNFSCQVSVKNHLYNYGVYNIHAYVTTKTGIRKCVSSTTTKVTLPQMQLNAVLNSGQTECRITGENADYVGALKGVKFAVWSEEKGQDDLKWYDAIKDSNGNWTYNVHIGNHKTAGKYQVHMYAVLLNGTQKILKSTTFTVNNPKLKELIGETVNSANGTFVVKASGVEALSGVGKIEVAIWSQSDQKDLKWYTMGSDGKGSYVCQVNIKDHLYNYGVYNIHAYVTTKTGIRKCVNAATVKIDLPVCKLSVNGNSSQESYRITGENVAYPGGVRAVKYAVWSEAGAQDDLRWYNAVKDANGNWIYDVKISNHKTAGKYQVHLYAVLNNGTQKFIKGTTFDVSGPTAKTCAVVNKDDIAGRFSIWIAGITARSGVEKVELAVWSKADQSNLKWYNAIDQRDGTYIAAIDIKNHGNSFGTYIVHVYITEKNGIRKCVNSTSYTVAGGYKIMGTSSVSLQQMVKYYNANASYPEYYSNTEASTIEEFCRIYLEECAYEGVKAEVAFCQAMKETNWLRYGGDVTIEQFNFAGIGATGNGAEGNWFATPRIGVRAQIQHLKGYASTASLNLACVDPRYQYVAKGCAPYVEWLGRQENPYNLGWATGYGYGPNIVSRISNLKSY